MRWLLVMLAGCRFTPGEAPGRAPDAPPGDATGLDAVADVAPIDGFVGAVLRINLGGAQYTGSSDNPGTWIADAEPGGVCNALVWPAPLGTTAINGTMDLTLFDKYVFANPLRCTIPAVPPGTYDVRLMIAEMFRGNAPCIGGAGQRNLDIAMEGAPVALAFDATAAGGGCAAVAGSTDGGGHAFSQSYSGIAIADGALDLTLTPTSASTAQNGVLSAIELVQTGP